MGYRAIAFFFFCIFFDVPVQAVCICHSGFFPKYLHLNQCFLKYTCVPALTFIIRM